MVFKNLLKKTDDVQKHREYRQKIISNYQPLHRELYTMHAAIFFVPSFLKAISENTEESYRNIMCEPSPGVLTFEMLQPRFCEMLLAEFFFTEVGGSTLDSHHGFVVEYGMDRDVDLGFHVDDSEVTLNVCLGKQFSGGELFFRGVRCEKHVNTETQPEEIFDYSHAAGCAVLQYSEVGHCGGCTSLAVIFSGVYLRRGWFMPFCQRQQAVEAEI